MLEVEREEARNEKRKMRKELWKLFVFRHSWNVHFFIGSNFNKVLQHIRDSFFEKKKKQWNKYKEKNVIYTVV